MPVAMTTSLESASEQTELSSQDLPTNPTAQEVQTWNTEKMLRWIQQRNPNILTGDNLEKFNRAYIIGSAFLLSDIDFYQRCGLPLGAGLVLKALADKVKESRFIPRT
jgi:hypothetical protein